jgi:hypothetical protein
MPDPSALSFAALEFSAAGAVHLPAKVPAGTLI